MVIKIRTIVANGWETTAGEHERTFYGDKNVLFLVLGVVTEVNTFIKDY